MTVCSGSSPDKALGLMTICRKAGKLILGFDAVKDAVSAGKAHCVLLSEGASARTKKETFFSCSRVPVYLLPADLETLSGLFHRRVAVAAVCDAGFAARFGTLLETATIPQPPQT